jgi:three-Cys-motif partner protein
MPREKGIKFDEIGPWSEIKLDIIRDYAAAYSRVLSAQTNPPLHHVYVDAFAGAGVHVSKATGEFRGPSVPRIPHDRSRCEEGRRPREDCCQSI